MKFMPCSTWTSYLMSVVMTTGLFGLSTAAAAEASESTTIFVSDENAPTTSSTNQQSAEGTLIIVASSDAPLENEAKAEPPKTASKPRSRRGDLVFLPDRPAPAAKAQPVDEPATLTSSDPVALPIPQSKKQAPLRSSTVSHVNSQRIDSVDELLLSAHAASHEAASEDDYTAILDSCVEAIRLKASGEKQAFARRMASWALNRRGQIRLIAGFDDLALNDFESALDYNPHHWRAIHNRGVSLAQAGQYADAFDDFNHVIVMSPNYAKGYANRATLYVQAGDLNAAIEDYQKATELDDQLVTAHIGLARACHALGRLDKAVERLDAAVQLDPTDPETICSRADLLADLGRYREALADYARTIELDPSFGHAYRNGAWLLATCPDAQFRDIQNAVIGARQALKLDYGERHVALDTLAAALANAGDFQQAMLTEQEAIDLAPDEIKFTYLTRLQQYQDQQPFRSQPVTDDIAPVIYEATDR